MSTLRMAQVRDQGRSLKEEAKHAGLSFQAISRRRKLARGECYACARPRHPESIYCPLHRLLHRFAQRARTGARPVGKGGAS